VNPPESGFDTFFCRPGVEGAHEKGGVEGEIGRFRRRHLVPVPKSASLAELNALIAAGDAVDDSRVITGRTVTVGAAFAVEAPTLNPLPTNAFDPARQLTARVDTRSRVGVRQSYYSVPARLVGRRLPVRLSATTVEVFDAGQRVAAHQRALGRGIEVLDLDHYLEVLKVKPGALPGATALAQAKAAGAFTPTHQGYWDAARRARGDAAGTRALIEVLLAHRTVATPALLAAMDAAVAAGVVDPQAVIIDARHRADRAADAGPAGDTTADTTGVIPMPGLARYDRPAPALTDYDQLLSGSQTAGAGA
jgi:hypothetical protein